MTLTLQPTEQPAPTPHTQSGFDFGRTVYDAWDAALVFAGWLAAVAIWLAIFSIFVLPVLAVVLLVRTVRRRRIGHSPKVSPASSSS
ncbi:MAG: hypothetical protein ACLQUY_18075 [Ktedonobacterales bacterium]